MHTTTLLKQCTCHTASISSVPVTQQPLVPPIAVYLSHSGPSTEYLSQPSSVVYLSHNSHQSRHQQCTCHTATICSLPVTQLPISSVPIIQPPSAVYLSHSSHQCHPSAVYLSHSRPSAVYLSHSSHQCCHLQCTCHTTAICDVPITQPPTSVYLSQSHPLAMYSSHSIKGPSKKDEALLRSCNHQTCMGPNSWGLM